MKKKITIMLIMMMMMTMINYDDEIEKEEAGLWRGGFEEYR